MDLLPLSFAKSPVLSEIQPVDFCEFKGETPGGFLRFLCRRQNEEFSLIVLPVIRKEESLIWKSCEELLERTVKDAAQTVRGIFGFQLLSIQLGNSIRSFQWDNLRQLIANHAKGMQPGEEKLIQYTSLFGILKKRVSEDWGKIEYLSPVTVYTKPAEQLDLLIKKMLKEGGAPEARCEVLLHDLSTDPLFRFGEEEQTSRMAKTLKSFQTDKGLSPAFILDSRGFVELGEQLGLRDYHV